MLTIEEYIARRKKEDGLNEFDKDALNKNIKTCVNYIIKEKTNLFNLDTLYRRLPKKAFIKSRKQELEILMMYYWLTEMEGDEEGYWQEYLDKVIPLLSNKNHS